MQDGILTGNVECVGCGRSKNKWMEEGIRALINKG